MRFIFALFAFFTLAAEGLEPFERFVGLGDCCVVRRQINRHLTSRFEEKDLQVFGGGQLFDWLYIHDYRKLAEAIENDLLDLFERSDLRVIYKSVTNVKYSMTWSHLFTKNQDKWVPRNVIDLEYDIRKEKINYLSEKFRLLRNYRTLYIIAHPYVNNLTMIEPTQKVLIRLNNALIKMRGNSNFAILFCPINKRFDSFLNIFVRQIYNGNASPSMGNDECWEKILSEFPYKKEEFCIDERQRDASYLN